MQGTVLGPRHTLNGDIYAIHTDLLFDPKARSFVRNTSIEVDKSTGLITKVYQRPKSHNDALCKGITRSADIDLRHRTVLPGFVDAHAHIFVHAYATTPALYQERDESFVERTVRATNHARTALLAGYTTYRDLGTEGLGDADVHFRDAINRGIIPGPRMFCATECLASSGGYEIRIESRDRDGTGTPRICDPCDGPWGVRAGVRRRLGAGADVIKIYADYRKRALRWPANTWPGSAEIIHPPGGEDGNSLVRINERNPNFPLYSQEELNAAVAEARLGRAPVAAHAAWPEAVIMAAKAGVTTIEHGYTRNDEAVQAMRENEVIFVPTLSVVELELDKEAMQPTFAQTKAAYDAGVKLACGGDTGAFDHGKNAREIELVCEAGVPVEEALTAATLHGWEACGGDWCGRKFGWFQEGCAADIVAIKGDPREDITVVRKVDFVMKDARIWKRDGQAIGMI
ncbi:hypothetical protein K431DRAFT_338302 [Polychaeton citri CBS 116435]|uniref:Amidohydrolase-related domain-containing protein n=1 Tax=Polychaeton citri CBS 116435 TaxID=1314669 RepID=A0A9P4QC69_9PEZI|nr:hypothetical protein K431DRAFT_338302 [Polychaeton citri CBS 116435]